MLKKAIKGLIILLAVNLYLSTQAVSLSETEVNNILNGIKELEFQLSKKSNTIEETEHKYNLLRQQMAIDAAKSRKKNMKLFFIGSAAGAGTMAIVIILIKNLVK